MDSTWSERSLTSVPSPRDADLDTYTYRDSLDLFYYDELLDNNLENDMDDEATQYGDY